jgi:hypothetical protein|tara:strand:- start:522 stop:665 length:144 start_codon:yes stop_codon:yes gene_type:complete
MNMTDNDHNAFVSTHKELKCENPYDEVVFVWEDWGDWEDEDDNNWWL